LHDRARGNDKGQDMTRKAFLIWGLVIIQLVVIAFAVVQYLAFSKTVDPKAYGVSLYTLTTDVAIFSFAFLLFLRFKGTGWRKKVMALCIAAPLFIVFSFIGIFLMIGYIMADIFGAHDRFFGAIYVWVQAESPKPLTPWTVMQRVEYILFLTPAFYLTNLGLFALLWFGSLDPRKPSQNRVINALKAKLARFTNRPADRPANLKIAA